MHYQPVFQRANTPWKIKTSITQKAAISKPSILCLSSGFFMLQWVSRWYDEVLEREKTENDRENGEVGEKRRSHRSLPARENLNPNLLNEVCSFFPKLFWCFSPCLVYVDVIYIYIYIRLFWSNAFAFCLCFDDGYCFCFAGFLNCLFGWICVNVWFYLVGS